MGATPHSETPRRDALENRTIAAGHLRAWSVKGPFGSVVEAEDEQGLNVEEGVRTCRSVV